MWAGYGDRHDVWADGGANRGTDMIFGPGRRIFHTRTQIWGQARCPVCRSGTFNVQRSTLNFQRSVRKGSCGRDMGTDTIFGRTAEQIEGQTRYLARAVGCFTRAPRYGDRHDVRYADQERSTSNAQLSTFNEVTERVQGGRDMGTDTIFGRTAEQIEGQTRYSRLNREIGKLGNRRIECQTRYFGRFAQRSQRGGLFETVALQLFNH